MFHQDCQSEIHPLLMVDSQKAAYAQALSGLPGATQPGLSQRQ